jgi:hypothetical protein
VLLKGIVTEVKWLRPWFKSHFLVIALSGKDRQYCEEPSASKVSSRYAAVEALAWRISVLLRLAIALQAKRIYEAVFLLNRA